METNKSFFFGLTILAAVISIGVLTGNPIFAKEAPNRTIVLGGTIGTKSGPEGRWLNLIYTEAFRRLGYQDRYDVPHKRISDVAAALGYRDPSSFSRSFVRWSGVSPRAFCRLRARGGGNLARRTQVEELLYPAVPK